MLVCVGGRTCGSVIPDSIKTEVPPPVTGQLGWLEAQNETQPRFHPSNNEKDSTTDAAGTTTSTHGAAPKSAVRWGTASRACAAQS